MEANGFVVLIAQELVWQLGVAGVLRAGAGGFVRPSTKAVAMETVFF